MAWRGVRVLALDGGLTFCAKSGDGSASVGASRGRGQTAVRLRIKLSFLANGQPFEDTGDVSNIPVV